MDRMFSGGGRESAAPHRVQSGRFPPGPPHAGFCPPTPGRPWCQQTRVLRCNSPDQTPVPELRRPAGGGQGVGRVQDVLQFRVFPQM